MIKLVVTDIDGTLLPEGTDRMPPELYEIVRELKERGILFDGASGRQYASMMHVFEPIAQDMIFIAENGSNVMCRGRNMATDRIAPQLAREVVAYIRTKKECYQALSTPGVMYIEAEDSDYLSLMRDGYHNKIEVVPDLMPYCESTNKLCLYCGQGVEHLAEEVQEKFGKRLNVMISGSIWIDFMNPWADKGAALATIQKLMHIKREETMAFGDNFNDMGMLKNAGESYAMENAHPKLKEAAKYIAPPVEEQGVLQVIRERLLAP